MKPNKVWVVIPAHNEEKNISNVLRETKRYCKNIIVVDDGSKDNTYDIAKKEGIIVLKQIINLGKGAALKTGCDYALIKGAEIIVVLDADRQHNPGKIPLFLKAIKNADIVFGYRELSRNMPFVLRFGNWIISKIVDIMFNMNLRDTQCGYRCFTVESYKKIRWNADDYSMESEMIARAGRNKLKYKEAAIETIYNDKYKGTTVVDGMKIVLKMILWRVSRWF